MEYVTIMAVSQDDMKDIREKKFISCDTDDTGEVDIVTCACEEGMPITLHAR